MPKITFMPMNTVIEANVGDSILETAIANGVPVQHACGGFCSCTTCHVVVLESPHGLAPMEDDEEQTVVRAEHWTKESRLGCQAKIMGDVTVKVVNIDE